ncbi:unnamed protein product [Prunus brigantina]
MASSNPPSIIRDHLYSIDDRLKRGKPPPLLKGANEDIIIDEEPAPEAIPVIDPASISRCCIERGLFPAVPLFFQYPCSTSKGWSEWVDHELKNPSTRDILGRAGVLEAIFASKACDIHIEAKTLRHLVRQWSTETHTFICSWGEFIPTLEDVANIFRLPLCGNQDPFHISLTPEDGLKLEALRKGAPTSPSTSLRFSNWIQFFGNSDRDEPCRLAAFISLWLGRFLFCDFSQDCLHGRVFPLALAIARGSMIPLAPMFLGHLYRLLDQIQFLEKGPAGTMVVETFANSSFLQIFLWEHFKGIEVSPLPHSKAESLVASDENSYVPDSVVLVEALATSAQSSPLCKEALLSAACLLLPTFGDDHLEVSVRYSPYRVRQQLGFDQGVPSCPSYGDSLALYKIFWTNDSVPGDGRPLALALANRQRLEKSGSYSTGKNVTPGKRKREESCSAEKEPAVKGPKRFIPKVATGGPPSSRKIALPEPPPQQQPVVSSSQVTPRTSSPRSASQNKGKGTDVSITPKRRSMRILETRFANTRKNRGEDSGPKVVVTVEDNSDDSSDGNRAMETGISIHEQESTHNTSGTDEDLDKDQYYGHDEDTYPDLDSNLEEPDASDAPPTLAGDHEQRIDIGMVVPFIEDTAGASLEAGFASPTAVADVILGLPAVQPSPYPSTSDTVAGASSSLPAVPPLISPIPSTPIVAAGTSPPLPAASPSTSLIPSTPVLAADTSPPLPAAPPFISPIPSTPDGDIYIYFFIAGCSEGHSPGKGMSWQDWENSYMVFRTFFDGGVTILRSVDELLPLCHKFDGYATFQGALVYPETVEALKRFMDKYGSLMGATDVTSSFSRCIALRALGLVLHGMDTMQLLDITDHKLLCWRDAICEAMILGFRVEFLLKLVKNLARAVFGARAIHGMQSSHDSDEVKAAADALNLKQQELENQRREMHALFLAKGISADSAECATEAAVRLSSEASFVFFGHSP